MELFDFLKNVSNEVYVFIISMFPIVELRGAIPVGHALGMNIFECYLLSVVGNMLPVPFILVFIKKILEWMSVSNNKFFNKLSNKLIEKADHRSKKLDKASAWGLFVFVAVPLPGTGAWTGALIASLMGMRFKKSFFPIFFGVLVAGLIVTAIAFFFFETLGWLL